MDVADKVAIVTGAANGIGRAIVEQLLLKNARTVVILDVNEEGGKKTLEELREKYGEDRVDFIKCDVSNATQLEAAFVTTKTRYERLDIVCNNAGIDNEFELEKSVAINLTAVIRGTYLAVEHMGTKNGGNGGVVINTASGLGIMPFPLLPIYTATKHGVVGFTRSVASEPMVVENAIRVSAICPGAVKTSITENQDVDKTTRYGHLLRPLLANVTKMTTTELAANIIIMIEDSKYDGGACMVSAEIPLTKVEPPTIGVQ
ncbi:15-hydroxyprostaglandin dehydrogenase [NAD(+)]-like [Saccoglossus kowalevskii]|uniref:15-hydroxyprostaglandin dehydrogenase [NAD(+)] n=1 Tax=Saccoglossus kowalevskii TaxID=10224 RepID=A0ABM0MPL6_SACKO|nr:PREDICTED: 15-hydroxyprostaglandin dehydrogenase [NAD(+)]-like [Saccoglossus kowalevskii]